MNKKNYKKIAKIERSIPTVDGKEILFRGEDTKNISNSSRSVRKKLKNQIRNLFRSKEKRNLIKEKGEKIV